MIIPFNNNSFNISVLAQLAKEGLEINIGTKDETLAKSVILLTQVFKCDCNNITLKDAGSLLRHSWHSFLVISNPFALLQLITESRNLNINQVQSVNEEHHIAIVSGDMDAWFHTIIVGMLDCGDRELRILLNEFYNHFKAKGFGQIFSDYRERKHQDQTLYLELK